MPQAPEKIVPVILSGGSGTRLWPMSRDSYPKQFLGIADQKMPLITDTLERVNDASLFHAPVMVGNEAHRFLLAEQMRRIGFGTPRLLIEPAARNTAPAITAAALYVQEHYGNAPMLVLPTDHVIGNCAAFLDGVARASIAAAKGYLVTFGIQPGYPETGYGYIKRGEPMDAGRRIFEIGAFVEKPDKPTAEAFLADGGYLWNSGMFMFPTGLFLEEIQTYQPEVLEACRQAMNGSAKDLDFIRLEHKAFSNAPDISVDYALMEHTKRAAVVALDCGWSDTGAWDALWNIAPKDADNNVVMGECYPLESKNCYLRSEFGPTIATLGVENLVVVATKDAVLVADKNKAQSLKALVAHLRQHNSSLVENNRRIFRPWGSYESIHDGHRFQVKRLTVKAGQKLSVQMHYHRAEHWIVVSGTGRMTCDDVTKVVTENESFYVPCGSVHSIENPGKIDLDIIEIQSGPYLGEDDIVRFADRYGRESIQP